MARLVPPGRRERLRPKSSVSLTTTSIAVAQESGDATSAGQLEEVVVTGSSIRGVTTPGSPVISMDREALTATGLATGGDLATAIDKLRDSIDYARRARAGLEFEARMLAAYADLLYRAARLDEALRIARQAVDVGRRRTDRIAELLGSLLLGLVRASTSALADDREAREMLAQSERLLNVSAARLYQPLLMELRSSLEHAR